MRVFFAAIFVFIAVLATLGELDARFPNEPSPWWTAPLIGLVIVASIVVATIIFNYLDDGPNFDRKSLAEHIAELEAAGLLVQETFQATRAFRVDEFEDEGLHYFIELSDRRVLFLSGQYLYDYEPITRYPTTKQERSFPCTEFEVLRHKEAGYVLHIQCAGTVLEPECSCAPFIDEDFERGTGIPEDGQIISDRTYESIKQERQAIS